jgi:hypothetical protein
MFLLGASLESFHRIFLRAEAGVLLNSIGVSLLPGLLDVQSQMAQYLAGLIQQIAVAIIILVPVLEFRRRKGLKSIQTIAAARGHGMRILSPKVPIQAQNVGQYLRGH